jgi:hypothetical protein
MKSNAPGQLLGMVTVDVERIRYYRIMEELF